MFPRQLSEQVFSLLDGSASSALSLWMQLTEDGSLHDSGVVCSTVRVTRMTYHELNERLAGSDPADAELHHLSKVGG